MVIDTQTNQLKSYAFIHCTFFFLDTQIRSTKLRAIYLRFLLTKKIDVTTRIDRFIVRHSMGGETNKKK